MNINFEKGLTGLRNRIILLSILLLFASFLINTEVYAQEPLKIAALPFEMHSVEDISDLRLMTLERLAVSLDRAKELEVVGGNVLKEALQKTGKERFEEKEAFSIGKELGADFIIMGSLNKIGKNLSLDISILNIGSKRVSALTFIEGKNEMEFLKKLPHLSDEIRKIVLEEALTMGRVFAKSRELISKIGVKGNKRINTGAILVKIKSKVGEPVSLKKIRDDIKAIYNMGFFDDIRVDLTDTAAGKELTYIVKEKPRVREIQITGNKALKEDKIKEIITVKPNTILKRGVLQEDVERIKALYGSEGYYLAKVKYTLEPVGDDVNVVFRIKEGNKVKIKRIEFLGNKVFTDRELKKVMRTKEYSLFFFWSKRGVFDEFLFDNDLNRILGKYFDNGYINADVSPSEIRLSDDKKWLFITINVEEGDQFKVGKVDIKGDIIKTRMELMEMIKTSPGSVFSRSVLGKDINKLSDLYADEGYAFVDVKPITKIDDKKKIVDITLDITKGEKVTIERIDISGNIRTRDKVIRREIELAEGDLYSITKLKRSKRNLTRLGFFDDVDITSEPGSAPDKMRLKVNVKERPTGSFSLGAGYSSVDNFIASLSISQNNLFGTGRRLIAEGTFSSSSKRYNISFTEPWLFDHPISAGFDLFRIDRDFPDFSRFSNGGDVRFGFNIYTDTRLFLTYKLEEVEVKDVSTNASLFIKEQEGRRLESSITNDIVRDTRNSLLDPTEGSVERLSIKFAGGFLGGDSYFIKYIAQAGKYFPMPKETTLFVRGTAGYVQPFGNRSIPIYERFFLGGINTIRGFETRSVGPKDPGTGEVIGGDKEIVLNLEYIFPLVKEQRIKGLIFFDAGNSYDVGDFDLTDLRKGAGVGIRWLSPLGLLRLEWGYNLDRRDNEKASQFEFSIGGSL